MKLRELLAGAEVAEINGDAEVEINGLAYDSRAVTPGSLFFCVVGLSADGHRFASAAVEAGAAALVVERKLELPVTQVRVADARSAMPSVAVRFWGHPTAELPVAGITGTNGKTTTAFLLRHILAANGTETGLLGTVKRVIGGIEEGVERTTPEAIDLQGTFRRMLDAGDRACVMEVSSHALALRRTAGIRFAVAVFMNLTQDHLDFHTDMEDYFQAKRLLFGSEADGGGHAPGSSLINTDDPYGQRLVTLLDAADVKPVTFSAGGDAGADLRAIGVSFDSGGSRFRCVAPEGEAIAEVPLPGHFNVENALAAIGAALELGVGLDDAAAALVSAERVPGRLEPVEEGQPFSVLVDYAHTPDSLENLLRAARRLTEGRLITVFGAGGDRDREKRPLMGEIGARLSDLAIVTSDNPRSEDPGAIIEEILEGIPAAEEGGAGVEVEPDRRTAIALALERARPGDSVVIAGKGHEQGQEFSGGRRVPFDDRQVAAEELRRLRSPVSPQPGAAG